MIWQSIWVMRNGFVYMAWYGLAFYVKGYVFWLDQSCFSLVFLS